MNPVITKLHEELGKAREERDRFKSERNEALGEVETLEEAVNQLELELISIEEPDTGPKPNWLD